MKNKLQRITIILLIFIIQGCGPKTFIVKNPQTSIEKFVSQNSNQVNVSKSSIAFIDDREESKKKFSFGRLPVSLVINGHPVRPIEFLQENVIKELNARNDSAINDINSETKLRINQFEVRNHRTNGYTPFITFSTFKANLEHNGQKHSIISYVKRGKVPVWSFNEVIDPTINEPLAIIIKEVSAKLNSTIYNNKISDTQVNNLIEFIRKNDKSKLAYLKVYDLGFGNNPKAINALVEFTKYNEEYIRLAAISSLGILQAESQTDYLWSIFESAKIWQDRAMALKALGDINTESSHNKLLQARDSLTKEKDKTAKWFMEVIELYIN